MSPPKLGAAQVAVFRVLMSARVDIGTIHGIAKRHLANHENIERWVYRLKAEGLAAAESPEDVDDRYLWRLTKQGRQAAFIALACDDAEACGDVKDPWRDWRVFRGTLRRQAGKTNKGAT